MSNTVKTCMNCAHARKECFGLRCMATGYSCEVERRDTNSLCGQQFLLWQPAPGLKKKLLSFWTGVAA